MAEHDPYPWSHGGSTLRTLPAFTRACYAERAADLAAERERLDFVLSTAPALAANIPEAARKIIADTTARVRALRRSVDEAHSLARRLAHGKLKPTRNVNREIDRLERCIALRRREASADFDALLLRSAQPAGTA